MTIDRANEILDPEHRENYDGLGEVNEACRMGMEALERTRDAVPVVRCRECISFDKIRTLPDGVPFGYCYHWDYEPGMSPNKVCGDDFCSYGEKKRPTNSAPLNQEEKKGG